MLCEDDRSFYGRLCRDFQRSVWVKDDDAGLWLVMHADATVPGTVSPPQMWRWDLSHTKDSSLYLTPHFSSFSAHEGGRMAYRCRGKPISGGSRTGNFIPAVSWRVAGVTSTMIAKVSSCRGPVVWGILCSDLSEKKHMCKVCALLLK